MDLKNVDVLHDWDKWKVALSKAVNLGENIGMSEEIIDGLAYGVGSFLSAIVDPENREERLLHELWKVGSKEDRKVLSKLIVKLVKSENVNNE
ncbi:DUF3243 domain-containing protein [Clostridium sp.]|uniref:DUF3243 domain-containing protein n=1 Tax=Clostridium sp. TaxID=1506 RepID=UPI002FC7B6B4